MSSPPAHFPIGGSIAARILACPGSLKFKNAGASSAAADRGSLLHEVVVGLQEGRWKTPEHAVGHEAFDQRLTPGDAKTAALPAWRATQKWAPPGTRYEVRVQFSSIKNAGGTADILAPDGVGDLKFGGVPVDVKGNAQLLFYTAAAVESRAIERQKRYRLAIIQPTRRPVLQETTVTDKRLWQFVERLQEAVENGKSRKPRFAGGDHCKYCPARRDCSFALSSQFASLAAANLAMNIT